MKKYYIILLMLVFGQGCSNRRVPAGILDEDKMVEILIDIHMAEGFVSTFPIHYDSSRKLYPFIENEVFLKHQVPDSVFKSSLEYYMRDSRKMNEMYARTIDSLSVKEKIGNQ